ncbi:helix-turn-helix transcriptional regulator [Rhodococcus sp. CX]|nr:helix-turn-helix transcriptional regulator [Rhodococcus sp. CX]
MRVEEVIGQRIQELRKARSSDKEMTQERLGALLAPLLGKPWSRQAVSAAEAGKRAFTAAEVVALASVLETTVDDLFDLRRQGEVTMPSGASLQTVDLEKLRQSAVDNDQLRDVLAKVAVLLRESTLASDRIMHQAALASDVARHAQSMLPDILRYLESEGEA